MQKHFYSYEQSWIVYQMSVYQMSVYMRTLSFAFFTFPIHLKQLLLASKQPSSLSIHSNSHFLQKRLQQVRYIAAKEYHHRFPDY